MSLFNFNVSYVSSVKYAAIAGWAATHAYSAGNLVRRVSGGPLISSGNVFVCYSAGTSGSTEPTWPGNRGQEFTTDGTVKWIEVGGQPGVCGDNVNTLRWSTVRNSSLDLGQLIKDVSNNLFVVTTSGTTNNTAEPTWNTTAGVTTTDGGVTWTCLGTIASFGNWGGPHPSIENPNKGAWASNINRLSQIYVSHDHAENIQGLSFTPGNTSAWGPLDMICVNSAGSVPPVTADLATTAVCTAPTNGFDIGGGYFRMVYGITFIAAGSANYTIQLSDGNADILWSNCTFELTTTGSSGRISISSGGSARCEDCTFTFANTGQGFAGFGVYEIIGGSIGATGSIPTSLFESPGSGCKGLFQGVDLSGLTGTTLIGGNTASTSSFQFVDCKMPSSYTVSLHSGDNSRTAQTTVIRCSASGNVDQFQFSDTTQDSSSDGTVVRTGGATGANPFSVKQVTRAACSSGASAAVAPPMVVSNAVTGANVTVTVFGIMNSATLPSIIEAYIDAHYMGTSGNTVATRKSTRGIDFLNSTSLGNCTADTSAWDTGATSRANSHAYSAGDVIKTSSNTGRVFFCTTAGTSASSEPGGFSTAIDGGSITDGTAVFRAGVRFKMVLVLTSPQPAIAGNITVYFRAGRASTTFYLDPLPKLS